MVVPLVIAHVPTEDAAQCVGNGLGAEVWAVPPQWDQTGVVGDAAADHQGAILSVDPATVPVTGRLRPSARQLWDDFAAEQPTRLRARPLSSARQLWDNFAVEQPVHLRARPQSDERYLRSFTHKVVNGQVETHEVAARCHAGECVTVSRETVPEHPWHSPAASKGVGGPGRTCLVWDGVDDLASWIAGKAGGLLARRARAPGDAVGGSLRSLAYSNVNGEEEFLGQETRCHEGHCHSITRRLVPTDLDEWAGRVEGTPSAGLAASARRAPGRAAAQEPPAPAAPAAAAAAPAAPAAPAVPTAPAFARHAAGLQDTEARDASADLVSSA
mmetsp:Transcript_91965/g.274421  ORF Transcript_91965/g.274421 Transcript_91965/m.274421 type:complete len:329 (+) Transcript_91965:73-1059(+)